MPPLQAPDGRVQNLELEMSISHPCPLMTEDLELDLSCPTP